MWHAYHTPKDENDPCFEYIPVNSFINIAGNYAASEKPVSPERLFRAALLKNRFVDTILRAKEKTMAQVGSKHGLLV